MGTLEWRMRQKASINHIGAQPSLFDQTMTEVRAEAGVNCRGGVRRGHDPVPD